MPDHSTIREALADIFDSNEEFFDKMKTDVDLMMYANAFIDLHYQKHDLEHYKKCLSSLRKACDKALLIVKSREEAADGEKETFKILNANQAIDYIQKQLGTGSRRETFKDWVEAIGIDRKQNMFSHDEILRIIDYVKQNYNKRRKKK